MKKILILGAGLSTSSLIKYLLDNSQEHDWKITLADYNEDLAKRKIAKHPNGKAIRFDIHNEEQRYAEVAAADIVISMLPASMHHLVAKACLQFKKNMVTASYVSAEVKNMNAEVEKAGLTFLNEIGVDPGIDHMSAMLIIDRIKEGGGQLTDFHSYTGGLVAPKYDNNPWNYKFTWNPRNVVLAGQGTAQFIRNGQYKYIPYHKLFSRIQRANVLSYGEFEVYPNRDSLKYRSTYGLDNIPTMFRGTMRRPGFARAWNVFVQLGATDDTYTLENSEHMTYRDFVNTFLRYERSVSVETKLAKYLGINEDSEIMYKLRWLGIFKRDKIGLKNATPAQILQNLLEKKWLLDEGDKDMIVMQHRFKYNINNAAREIISSLVVEGTDTVHTAMSKTVGIPVGIATKLILNGIINTKGVVIPTKRDIYLPVLTELEDYEIKFIEEKIEYREVE